MVTLFSMCTRIVVQSGTMIMMRLVVVKLVLAVAEIYLCGAAAAVAGVGGAKRPDE